MPSATNKIKRKVICHIPTSNQLEDIKPIQIKCFDNAAEKTTLESEKIQSDATATMITIAPRSKRPVSGNKIPPPKSRTVVTAVTDMVVSKPIRHLAILPTAKMPTGTHEIPCQTANLSETFTRYDGPTTTPVVGRSLDGVLPSDVQKIPHSVISIPGSEVALDLDGIVDDLNPCDHTTVSSVCELVDRTIRPLKPHSLIGRYQSNSDETVSKPGPVLTVATVQYNDIQETDIGVHRTLIHQFYAQLEKMKATMNIEQPESSPQMTTKTLAFDNGQVRQTSATSGLKEKTVMIRTPVTPVVEHNKKSPIAKKERTAKLPVTRIKSAPVMMATCPVSGGTIESTCPRSTKVPTAVRRLKIVKKLPLSSPPVVPIVTRRTESAPPVRIETLKSEVTLLPKDELECREMYDKLKRLQPDGVCVDLNTLRRALYPPVALASHTSAVNQPSLPSSASIRVHRPRIEEIPQSWTKVDDRYPNKYAPKQINSGHDNGPSEPSRPMLPDNASLDRIVDQVKKHSAINYSYYTRTK